MTRNSTSAASNRKTRPLHKTAAPPIQQVRHLSEAHGFRSRERDPVKRRHRTGRNVQLNVKVTPETLAEFNALCERYGWVQGEALAHAIEALKTKLRHSEA
ncbi:MAG: hypothetical protein HC834_04325 [Rhodospirillales bacterium]|nr:hypothetical protein [Rhodospirillales bacterium]